MSSCTFEELVSRVAAMLNEGVALEDIDQFLEMLSSEYRAEVLASAHDSVRHDPNSNQADNRSARG